MFWYGSEHTRNANPELKILMEYNPRSYADPSALVRSIFRAGYHVKRIKNVDTEDCFINQKEMLDLPVGEHIMLLISKQRESL